MAVLFRVVHIAQQLGKCEEVMVMLMCLMLVSPPQLIHLGGPSIWQQILGKWRGQLWWTEGVVEMSVEPQCKSDLILMFLIK